MIFDAIFNPKSKKNKNDSDKGDGYFLYSLKDMEVIKTKKE